MAIQLAQDNVDRLRSFLVASRKHFDKTEHSIIDEMIFARTDHQIGTGL